MWTVKSLSMRANKGGEASGDTGLEGVLCLVWGLEVVENVCILETVISRKEDWT